jgi:hypothetical protein
MNSNKKSSDAILLELFSKLKEPTYKDDEEEEFTWKEYLDMLPKSEPNPPKITKPLLSTITLPKISTITLSKTPKIPKTLKNLMSYRPHPYLKPIVPATIKIGVLMTLGYMTLHSANPMVRLGASAGIAMFGLM